MALTQQNLLLNPTESGFSESIQWLMKFVDQRDSVPYISHIYCDGQKLIGTNGFILASLPTTKHRKGYYCPNTVEKIDVSYDNYPTPERIIPHDHTISLINIEPMIEINENNDILYVYKTETLEVCVQKKFVDIVLTNPAATTNVLAKSPYHCLLWNFEDGSQAIIMPFDRR